MGDPCYVQYLKTEVLWTLHKYLLKTRGYRIERVRDEEQQTEACRIRGRVYAHEGYAPKTELFCDEFESISTQWLVRRHTQAVGTIRATPLDKGRAPVFKYIQNASEVIGKFQNKGVEIGRLAVLPPYRGTLLSITLLLAAYRWSLRKGYTYILWGGGAWLYRWLREAIPDAKRKKIEWTRAAQEEMEGYFHKYRNVMLYVIPICQVSVLKGTRALWRKRKKRRS